MSEYLNPFAPVLPPVTVPVPCPAQDSLQHVTLDPDAALDFSCPAVMEPPVAQAELFVADPNVTLPTDVSTDPDIYLRRYADVYPPPPDGPVARDHKLYPRDHYSSLFRYYLARRRAGEDSIELELDPLPPPPINLRGILSELFQLVDSGRETAAEQWFNACYEILALRIQRMEMLDTMLEVREKLRTLRDAPPDVPRGTPDPDVGGLALDLEPPQ